MAFISTNKIQDFYNIIITICNVIILATVFILIAFVSIVFERYVIDIPLFYSIYFQIIVLLLYYLILMVFLFSFYFYFVIRLSYYFNTFIFIISLFINKNNKIINNKNNFFCNYQISF